MREIEKRKETDLGMQTRMLHANIDIFQPNHSKNKLYMLCFMIYKFCCTVTRPRSSKYNSKFSAPTLTSVNQYKVSYVSQCKKIKTFITIIKWCVPFNTQFLLTPYLIFYGLNPLLVEMFVIYAWIISLIRCCYFNFKFLKGRSTSMNSWTPSLLLNTHF